MPYRRHRREGVRDARRPGVPRGRLRRPGRGVRRMSTITPSGTGMSVRIDQVQQTPVPAFARRIIGSTTRAVQLEEWSDHRNAVLEIETPGIPGSMTGTITIEPSGSHATEVVELDVRSGVPIIGGRLEKLMARPGPQGHRDRAPHRNGLAGRGAPVRFQHELTYDAAPGEVYAMLADPAFREEVCEYQQVLRYSRRHRRDRRRACSVDVDQVQAMRGPATSVARSSSGTRSRSSSARPGGPPPTPTLDGDASRASPAGCPARSPSASGTARPSRPVEGEIKVGVPLIGRQDRGDGRPGVPLRAARRERRR